VLVDLHAHYPMHVAPGRNGTLLDRYDSAFLATAGRVMNHASPRSGPRVTIDGLREGGVGVALSVLCTPLVELGDRLIRPYRRRPPYGHPPGRSYFPALLRQLDAVEQRVAERHGHEVVIARHPDELTSDRLVLVHCVEGGFALGTTPDEVDAAVTELARRGVAYITLAHLFWRHVTTNVPCLPPLPEHWYRRLFPQPEDVGLTALGRAAVTAMAREGVLLDLTHMSDRARDESLELLDPAIPVITSHTGYRFGTLRYTLDARTVERIAARGGVIGLILSEYFATDGLHATRTLEDSLAVLFAHIDRIAELTGSYEHVAIGSDHDGFVKPTLAGLGSSRDLKALPEALVSRYGADAAQRIASGNALRVLRAGWAGVRPPATARLR
jgi:microsomal dipeptidase-like Zn-dependent dipeptidase